MHTHRSSATSAPLSALKCLFCLSAIHLSLPLLLVPSAHAELLHNSQSYENGDLGPWPYTNFYSTDQNAPRMNTPHWDPECEDGLNIFFTPRCDVYKGGVSASACPTIIDDKGELVWRTRKYGQVNNLKVQKYKGIDYLTFWGKHNGKKDGEYFMLNSAYEEVYKFKVVGERLADFHEWRITRRDTALVSFYKPRFGNMSYYGMDQGWYYDSGFQEINIETGELIFEWIASEHWELTESFISQRVVRIMKSGSRKKPFDFYHFNSVQEDDDGNYLISSRHTSTVSYISGKDGSVLWNLGGKHNNFTDLSPNISPGATKFGWQHHARWEDEEKKIIRLFDNQESQFVRPHVAKASTALVIQLDLTNMTAEIIQKHDIPEPTPPFLAVAEGSFQRLDNGDSFINWGAVASFTQYNETGGVKCNIHYGPEKEFGSRHQQCYRAYKAKWVGKPDTKPDIKVDGPKAYVSWMGSTEVKQWQLSGIRDEFSTSYEEIRTTSKSGFETAITLNPDDWFKVKVAAMDESGEVLSESKVVLADGSEPATGITPTADKNAAGKTGDDDSDDGGAGIDQLAGQDPYPNTHPVPPPGESLEESGKGNDPDYKEHHIDVATAGKNEPHAPVASDDEPIINVGAVDKETPEGPVDHRPDDPGYNVAPYAADDAGGPGRPVQSVDGASVAKAGLTWGTFGVETRVAAGGWLTFHAGLLLFACVLVVCVMRARTKGLFRKRFR